MNPALLRYVRRFLAWTAALLLLTAAVLAQETTPACEQLPQERGDFARAIENEPERLRIVSYNVHLGEDLPSLEQALGTGERISEADLYLLQEIESYPDEGKSRARTLAEKLALNYVYAPARRQEREERVGTHGLALLSRYPIVSARTIPLPYFEMKVRPRCRVALLVTVEVAGRRLRLVNLHLDTRLNSGDRLEQIEPVLALAREESDTPLVVAGDFNTNSFWWLWNTVPLFYAGQGRAIREAFAAEGFEAPLEEEGPTMRRWFGGFGLDKIFLRGVEPTGGDIEAEVKVSDHYPLWVELRWPPAPSGDRP